MGSGMKKAEINGAARRHHERGFTLVEVIVVLSVVLLLTGIAVPMLSSYMEDGRRARRHYRRDCDRAIAGDPDRRY